MATILTTGSAAAIALNSLAANGGPPRNPGAVHVPAQTVAAKPPAPATETSPTVQPKAVARELEQVQQAIEKLKESIKPALANTLEFQIDESTGRTLVKILDTETNTVVRQIPSEEIMAIAHAIDRMQGRSGLVQQRV